MELVSLACVPLHTLTLATPIPSGPYLHPYPLTLFPITHPTYSFFTLSAFHPPHFSRRVPYHLCLFRDLLSHSYSDPAASTSQSLTLLHPLHFIFSQPLVLHFHLFENRMYRMIFACHLVPIEGFFLSHHTYMYIPFFSFISKPLMSRVHWLCLPLSHFYCLSRVSLTLPYVFAS